MTAMVSGAKSGLKRSAASPVLSLISLCVSCFWVARTIAASTAVAPSASTITGFMSSSAISLPCRVINPSEPPTFRSRSTMASVETPSSPRTPSRTALPRSSSSIARASASLIGQSRKEASLRTSMKTPPRPTIIIGPNCGSHRPPTTTSFPGGAISSMRYPSTSALVIAGSAAISIKAAFTDAVSVSPRRTPPASLLCRMSAERTFSAKGGFIPAIRRSISVSSATRTECGTLIPYPARSAFPSISFSAVRPPARASWRRSG